MKWPRATSGPDPGILSGMWENLVLAGLVFAGFLWLKRRARGKDLGSGHRKTALGLFILLPALLILESRYFDGIAGGWAVVALKGLLLGLTFALVGLVFLPRS